MAINFVVKTTVRIALTVGLLGLTGCSGMFKVYAIERDGALAFTVEPQGTFGFDSCVDVLEVTDANGNILWDIIQAPSAERECENEFPIIYGVVPAGFEETAPAPEIITGTRYSVNGRSPGVRYDGTFMMTGAGQYVNFEHSEEIEVPANVH